MVDSHEKLHPICWNCETVLKDRFKLTYMMGMANVKDIDGLLTWIMERKKHLAINPDFIQ